MDDSRPSGKLVTGEDLRAAMDAVLAGKPVNPEAQHWLQHRGHLETNLAIMVRRVAQAQLDNDR